MNDRDMGIRRLWGSVVLPAVRDADMNTRDGKDARMWLQSDDYNPQSFRWICDSMDLDFRKLQMLATTRHGRQLILGKSEV